MFGQKTTGSLDPQNKNTSSDKQAKVSAGDLSFIENLPIFTMKTDLENIEHPGRVKEKEGSSAREVLWEKEILTKGNVLDSSQEAQKKKSPFLDMESAPAKTVLPAKEETKKETPIKVEETKTEEKSSTGFFSFFKKKKPEQPKNIPVKLMDENKKESQESPEKIVEKNIAPKIESVPLKKEIEVKEVSEIKEVKETKEIKPEKEITLVSNASLLRKSLVKPETKKRTRTLRNFIPFVKEKDEAEISKEKELTSLNSEMQKQKEILEKIKEEEKNYSEKNLHLRDEVVSKEKELSDKKANIQKIEAEIVELSNKKKELDILNAQLSEQKNILARTKEEEKNYSEKNLRLRDEMTTKERELNEKKANIQRIEAQIAELNNKKKALDDLNIQIENQRKTLSTIKGEEAQYTQKNLRLRDEVVSKERELNEKKANIQRIEAQIAELNNKKKELDTKSSSSEKSIFSFGIKKQPAIPATISNPQIIQKPMEKTIEKKPEEKNVTKSNKKLVFAVASLFVLMIIVGGYYSWINRNKNNSEMLIEIPEITGPEIDNTIPILSLEGSNYLSVDLENATLLSETLNKYLTEVAKTNPKTLVEFIFTDKMNNPVSFENFAKTFNLTLPENVLTQLNQDFNLYIYNYGEGKMKLGISINSKDDIALESALKANEGNLLQQITPLILENYTSPEKNVFNDGKYNEVKIRYQNITNPEEIALDYAIYNNNLIIGTTKSTAFSILDRKNPIK